MKKQENWIKKNVLLIFIGIIILMIIVYIANFHNGFSRSDNSWGNFGSYFGSFTGLLAFGGVLYTAWQSEKRAEEEKTIREQAEKHTKDVENKAEEYSIKREERDLFFKLLELHQNKINTIIHKDNSGIITGFSALEKYSEEVKKFLAVYLIDKKIELMSDDNSKPPNIILERCKNITNIYPQSGLTVELNVLIKNAKNKIGQFSPSDYASEARLAYCFKDYSEIINLYGYGTPIEKDDIYKALKFVGNVMSIKYGQFLGPYYRNMYYILYTCSHNFKYDTKYYLKLYRAQLSRIENILCLVNAVSGSANITFAKLLLNNNILNSIQDGDLFITKLIENYPGHELQFVKDMLNLYLEEHKDSN